VARMSNWSGTADNPPLEKEAVFLYLFLGGIIWIHQQQKHCKKLVLWKQEKISEKHVIL